MAGTTALEAGSTGLLPVVAETKLQPPLVREGALPRSALVAALQQAIDTHEVTLLSAGAGFGKTSLLAAWYASRPVKEAIAWVTLDSADDDPVRFWSHIAEALRRTYRERLRHELGAPPEAGLGIAVLVNELVAIRAPRVLVLDDFHRVTNLVCADGIDAFIAAMPPRVRLVIASRSDPPIALARLRAEGKLGELRGRDLAYTNAEARELVAAMPQVRLGARDAELLRRRTEGWPAGMYLALLAATDRDDPHAFVREFAGDVNLIADYLGEEVLARLDEETRSFLVRSSALDELSGPLCDAALETTGSGRRLAEVERSNLFLVPLDDRREWFRFHQLFRDVLHREWESLDPGARADIHRRASVWYETVGARPALAIEHAVAAQRWHDAGRLIMRTAFDAVHSGRWVTVLNWISALPEEEMLARPLLPAFAVVIVTSLRGDPDEIGRWLAVCARARRRHPDLWSPEADVCVSYPRAVLVGTNVGAAVDAAALLVDAGSGTALGAQTIAYGLLAWNRNLAGDEEGAEAAAVEALADEDAGRWATGRMHAYAVLSLLAVRAGDTKRALVLAERAASAAQEFDVFGTAIAGRAHMTLAIAYGVGGKLEQAEAEAITAIEQAGPTTKDASRVLAHILLSSIRRRRGRFAQAREALDDAERALRGFVDPGRLPLALEQSRRELESMESTAGGVEPLSEAEQRVLDLLATELSLRQIGARLFLSPNTVKTHCRSIYRKLRVNARADAVVRAHDLGLLGNQSPG